MPSLNTAKYRSFLARRLKETLTVKEAYESLSAEIASLTPNLANGASFATTNTLLADIDAATSRLYLCIGRPSDWTNDNNPPTPTDVPQNIEFEYWRDLLAAKRVMAEDASYVVPRYNWTANTVYTQYDDQGVNGNANATFANTQFYVLDSTELPYKVYKCLWNNNGAVSTNAPSLTGNTVTPATTSDGYVWQYLYSIRSDDYKFLTDAWMPVKTDPDVETSAENNQGQLWEAVPLVMINNGNGFNPSGTFTFTYSGDGNGAVINTTSIPAATAFSANTIAKIQMANGGLGYTTFSTVTIAQSGASSATARVIIPPYPNHGYKPQIELGASAIMLSVELNDDELNRLTTVNNYRRILLMSDPMTPANTAANGEFYRLTYDITFTGNTGVFAPDDTLQVDNESYPVSATVVDVVEQGANTVVRVTNVSDFGRTTPFVAGDTILDMTQEGVEATIAAVNNSQLLTFTGEILYADQRAPVTRNPNQSEQINLVFKFQ